jgi:hypothetical protein
VPSLLAQPVIDEKEGKVLVVFLLRLLWWAARGLR